MSGRYRRAIVAWLGCAVPLAFAACAGKSSKDPSVEHEQGGSSGMSGASSNGGSKEGRCSYNGVHYERGESFGECNECTCDDESGVVCKAIGCVSGTGGMGNSMGGASAGTSGGMATSGGSPGCTYDGKHFDEGASWPVACNTCYCKASQAVCGKSSCPASTGGSVGAGGGGAGAGATGGQSEGGANAQCTQASIGSFCVLGTPSGDGQDFAEGMPLSVSMRPAGCHSSSCTRLVSSDCNYIGSGGVYWVSGFICLATLGGKDVGCTADCGGGGNPVCKPGVTLTAGDYTIGIGGTSLAVKFSVPSHVANDLLCASTGEP